MDLESPNFDVLWLKIFLPTVTVILCFCYCSPDQTDYPAFFQYLTSCHDALLTSHPHAEVLYMKDFNVHHIEWLNSNTTDVGGKLAKLHLRMQDTERRWGNQYDQENSNNSIE